MKVYVVTNVEMGWDCVCGVFADYRSAVRRCFYDDDREYEELAKEVENGDTSYVIHEKRLEQ